jgi:dihydrofolate reductase
MTNARPRTIYFVAATADGYIADPQGGLEWLFPFDKAEGVGAHYQAFIGSIGALAMGSATYEFRLAHGGPTWPYPGQATWVFTHRALPRFPTPDAAQADIRFTQDDVGEVHRQMLAAAGGKDLWVVGGGNLVAQFVARGLLDEIHLGLAPVVLGRGIPLLPVDRTTPLELIGVKTFGMSFVELRYKVGR